LLAVVLNAKGENTAPAMKTFTYKKTKQANLEIIIQYPPGWKETDKRPGIVFFFSGGWTGGLVEQFEPQAGYLASRGMVAARADYRVKSRHGVTPKECVEDAKSAVRWMRQNAGILGIDPDRIVAAGGSAGGHIAACTAFTPGLEADGESPMRSISRSIASMPGSSVGPMRSFNTRTFILMPLSGFRSSCATLRQILPRVARRSFCANRLRASANRSSRS
jgi:carboxylesterase type B